MWSITSCADFAKVGTGEIGRATDGDHAVTTESGRVEVRVIENIEDFRTELEPDALVERKILEDREVQPMEAWSWNLGR